MVSRRRILSRSTDDLNLEAPVEAEEEDVWFNKDKLYMEHVQEVLSKWESIDDEIWAKIIVLERNRRVAKAYARAPVITVNGSDDGFDGFRIGLAGFDNPMRDVKTEEVKRHIGQGCKIKMDDSGNILIKRIAKSNVYVKNTTEENSISNDILKLPNGALEPEKPAKLFDMKKFQQNVSRELKRAYPDRRKLECQCICSIAFVKNEIDVLDSPCWIMLINIVAMDMLKSKIPPVHDPRSAVDIRNRPRIPIPDEDPYSVAGSGSSGNGKRDRSREKPPKLPPRDNAYSSSKNSRGDYDRLEDHRFRQQVQQTRSKQSRKDDPYYCGLRARIPNFAKTKSQKDKDAMRMSASQELPMVTAPQAGNGAMAYPHHDVWHKPTRGYHDTGMIPDYESDYSHIYGRLPIPTSRFKQYPHPSAGKIYVSEWE